MIEATMNVRITCNGCGSSYDTSIDLLTCDLLDGAVVVEAIAENNGFVVISGNVWCEDCYDKGDFIQSSDDTAYSWED